MGAEDGTLALVRNNQDSVHMTTGKQPVGNEVPIPRPGTWLVPNPGKKFLKGEFLLSSPPPRCDKVSA